jgi:hypothetical protein
MSQAPANEPDHVKEGYCESYKSYATTLRT